MAAPKKPRKGTPVYNGFPLMTWEEITAKYPDHEVLIGYPEKDIDNNVIRGYLVDAFFQGQYPKKIVPISERGIHVATLRHTDINAHYKRYEAKKRAASRI